MADNEVTATDNKQSQYKRKRKKTFLRNAKKYAKKGCYGRGSHLEADTYDYLVRIMDVYKAGFPSEEEKSIFVNNVFDQIESQEITCACNQVGCRIIEILLPFAGDEILERFMDAFKSELRPLCSDRFASHVLEAMLRTFCAKSLDKDTTEEFKVKCKEYTLKISKFLLNNLEDYVWDTYGNHIIRTALECLAQLPSKDDPKKPYSKKLTAPEDVEPIAIPDDYQEVVKDYALRLSCWPQFKDLPYEELPSGLLQVLVKAIAKVDKAQLKLLIKKLLNDSFLVEEEDESIEGSCKKLPQVFMSKPALMLLESLIQVSQKKNYTQIYAKCFAGKLVALANMRNTNFAVQKLLTCCEEKLEFEAMFDELHESFKEIIEKGHSGVILALGQSCKRLATKQGSFVQELMKALDCYEPQEKQNDFFLTVLKLCKHERLQASKPDQMILHGSLLVQLMLEFNKPIKIITSVLNVDTDTVKTIFCHPMGSHVADSYVNSAYVGEKSREKLVRKMQGTYQELAMSKHGSRSFEAIWGASNLKSKEYIMNELAYKDGVWSNSDAGKIIAGKVNLVLYKRNKEEWKTSWNKSEKTKSMFADILKK